MWKKVPGYDDYEASEDGQIRKISTQRIVKQSQNQVNHYMYASLSWRDEDGVLKRKNCLVHRIIATTFLPNPDGLPQVNHKDSNRVNNDISNLEWINVSDNLKHSFRDGRRFEACSRNASQNFKEWHEKTKKPIIQKTLDGDIVEIFSSVREAANKTKITYTNIGFAANGKRLTAGGYKWEFVNSKSQEPLVKKSKCVKVEQLSLDGNLINIFNSIVDAAKATGCSERGISAVINGRNKTSGGFKWRRVSQGEEDEGA